MCTVFAESEVISLVGAGKPREDIAHGIIESVVSRVATLAGQGAAPYFLTGGLYLILDGSGAQGNIPAQLHLPAQLLDLRR